MAKKYRGNLRLKLPRCARFIIQNKFIITHEKNTIEDIRIAFIQFFFSFPELMRSVRTNNTEQINAIHPIKFIVFLRLLHRSIELEMIIVVTIKTKITKLQKIRYIKSAFLYNLFIPFFKKCKSDTDEL